MNWHAARQAVRFMVVVWVTVAVLAVLNLLPQFLRGEPRGVVRYADIQSVATAYRASVWWPATLPKPWDRTPSLVRVAVGYPDWMQAEFRREGGSPLTLCQALEATGNGESVPEVVLPRGDVLQTEDVSISGRVLSARRLLLGDGAIVHELWWRANGRNVMLRLHGPLEELTAVFEAIGK